MKYIQFVGFSSLGAKIFIDITIDIVCNNGQFMFLTKEEYYMRPIHPDEYNNYINLVPSAGRYVVTKICDVYEITESHRDSYSSHLPGAIKLDNIELGEIIPLNGFPNTSIYHSNADKLILSKQIKFSKYIHENANVY